VKRKRYVHEKGKYKKSVYQTDTYWW